MASMLRSLSFWLIWVLTLRRIKELVATQPKQEGSPQRVRWIPAKHLTIVALLFNAFPLILSAVSRSQRHTDIHHSRVPTQVSEETTNTLCTVPWKRWRRSRKAREMQHREGSHLHYGVFEECTTINCATARSVSRFDTATIDKIIKRYLQSSSVPSMQLFVIFLCQAYVCTASCKSLHVRWRIYFKRAKIDLRSDYQTRFLWYTGTNVHGKSAIFSTQTTMCSHWSPIMSPDIFLQQVRKPQFRV